MRYLKVKLSITTAMILIAGIAITSMPRVSAQREKNQSVDEQKLLDIAAQREGADASQLQLLHSTTAELPLTGRRVRLAKILDQSTDRVLTASIDEQGQAVDFPALRAEEQRAHRARYGKLDPKLHKKTESVNASQKVKVAFWLNPTDDLEALDERNGRTNLTAEEVEQMLARRAQQVKAATSRATDGLARALQRAGHAVQRLGQSAPVVFATLPAGLVRQVAERADVQLAYLAEDNQYEDHMNVAGPSIKADALWALGINGAGSRIAIIEEAASTSTTVV